MKPLLEAPIVHIFVDQHPTENYDQYNVGIKVLLHVIDILLWAQRKRGKA